MSTRITGIGSLGVCRGLIHAVPARASGATGGLLAAALLAALPLQAMAQTQGVSVSANPAAFGQYVSIKEREDVTFTVSRTGDNSKALTVNYSISSGGGPANLTAEQAGEGDYTSDIPTSYEFPAGSSASHEFTVTAVDDETYEPNQYFTLTASGSYQDQGSTISFNKQLTVRITENDERYLTLSPVSDSALVAHPEFMAKEGGISGGKNELTISLNDPLPYPLDIGYTVGDDPHTTAAKSDFTMKDGTAQIPQGEKSVTIDIGITDDDLVEPTEYFTLQLRTPTYDKLNNARGTYNQVNFQDSKLPSQPLSVSIMDDDTASTGGVVYLRGEEGGGIPGFPSTRRTRTEGQTTTITAEIAGTAPSSDIEIPLKFDHYPSGEATSADYSIEKVITIESGKKSGAVTLTITEDTDDERYRELLVVEIDDMTNFPTGYTKGDRSKYEVVMLDNDKTPANLLNLSKDKLKEDAGDRMATFELLIDRRPKADPAGPPPFTGADTDEGNARLVLGYTGTATHGTDYNNPPLAINIPKSGAALPDGCSASDEAVTCTVTLKVTDDKLYEGGAGTTESVKIDLNAEGSSFNDGIKRATEYESLDLTIEDNDLQPMLAVGDVTATEGSKLTFDVTRTGAMENKLSVQATTADDNDGANRADARSDYTAREKTTLNFAKNTLTQTFEVTTIQDVIDEPDETFLVKLSDAKDTGGEPKPAIKTGIATGTIKDNDDAPTALTVTVDTDVGTNGAQDTIAEAAGETPVRVTATITSSTRFATKQTVTITVGKEDDTAVEGTDYGEVADDTITITIPATQASGTDTFELTPVNDDIDDDGEKISVEGALAGMTVTHDAITIEDDDTRGITVSKATLTIDEADDTNTGIKEDEGTYEVALTSQPEGGTVTVNVTNEGIKVATVKPSSLTFDTANWEMAQTVTVIAKNDSIDDTGDQKTTTITHTVSAADTDYADEEVGDVEVTVLDDDAAPTALTISVETDTSNDGDQDTISEGAASPSVRITATLDGDTQFATDKDITITVGDSDKDTATEGEGGDYGTVAEFVITLPAGDESVSYDLPLTLNDDSVDESDETVTVTGALAGVTVTGTTITIEDNDDTPTVMLVLTPASINESGATDASTVTATMDGKSSEAVTLEVSATPVSPAVAGDLTLSDNITLTIPALTRASTGVLTITAVDNDVDAADKTVTVAATATGGNELVQAPGSQTLTITDDDTRGITVSKATLTLDEEDNTATMEADEHLDTYTVVLDSEPSGGTVTIRVASGDTNIAGVAPATLTFDDSDWDEPQTVTVTAVADGIDNPNDRRTAAITHTVTATGTDYDGATASGVTVTVNDDDGAPTLSINSPSVTEVDSGATATLTFTVRLTPASGNTVTVDYADTGTGTATSGGTDYETLPGGTLTFDPGDTSQSVGVTVNGDAINETDETVVVRLSSPSNATLTGGATTLDGTGTINDNDPTPTVSVADATAVSEGNVAAPDPSNNMRFAVTLSAVSGLDVTVPYTLDGTATGGTDYTEPDPRSVTIDAGQTQADIEIPVAGDEVDEENETIIVTLGTPTNATVSTAEGAGTATGTITDDDTRGVSVTPTELTVAEEDNAGTAATREDQETYKVVLTSQPTGAVTVNLNSDDESVARIDTASLVFDTDNWNTERMVTVTGQADVIDNTGDMRKVDISHTVSAAGTDYDSETAEDVAVTVTDDDAAPSGITLTASPDSVTENGGAKIITVTAAVNGATRYAQARTVSVSIGGGTAVSDTDYTAVESFDITIGAGQDDASNTFTLTPENDVLAEGNETIDVTGTLSGITITPDEIVLTDDDAAPTGITLSVDTNGATSGTPSTVAEDAGATVVTVTATVNGTTRYVEAKTVAVSVADGTAASPADYAAVTNFNIIIGAGAASHTGSFTVTPVDDDLDEADETIDVTGTLTDITITGAMVTFTDTDDPVSFSIADAEATEGGKITFTVSRKGAEDNVASVKVATAADSGEGVKAAGTDDYTAIAPAQTLNFAAGTTSQTVEVQTTQDDLFEPDETFRAVLSDPALADGDPGTGVSIEMGKGTAIGTIKNDDTEPSFAVADASASEGDAITFTVTRSGAQDNAVSVKWNTKADSGAGAAATTDYTAVTAPTTLTFAKGVSSQDFTVATTEDVLAEGNETFLVELTGAVGGTITTAGATGTITDDDAAPTGITLSVDTNGATSGTPSTVAEDAGATVVTVTATVNGTTRYVEAKTVAVSVADGTAASPADYAAVTNFNIIIGAGAASHTGSFTVTPVDDDLDEADETIDVTGTLTDITITGAMVTFTDTDDPVSFSIADAEATEGGKITFTVSRKGAEDNVASVKVATAADSGEGVKAAGTDDYTAIAPAQTLNFAAGTTSQTVEVQTTQDDLFEPDETFRAVLSDPALADGDPGTGVSIEMGKGTAIGTIKNDDTEPSFAVADASASEGDAITFTVTRSGAQDNAVSVKWNTKADSGAGAAATTDYTAVTAPTTLTFAKGVSSQDFTVATTEDVLAEGNETFLVELTGAVGGTITTAGATGTITDDDAAPTGITLSVDTNGATSGTPSTVAEDAGATVVTVTATVNGTTRYVEAKTVAVSVADGTAASPADYAAVTNFNIIIGAGAASHTGSFTVTPVDDDLDEADETIDVTGTLTDITITGAMVTFTDTDDPVSFSIADAEATEGGKITFTVSRKGAEDNVASVKVATAADSGEGVKAAGTDDYTAIAPAQTLNFAAGTTSQTVEVQTTQDDLFEPDETFRAVLSDPALADGDPGTGVSIEMGKGTAIGTIKNDDTEPSFAVADASASEGDAITFTVTRSGAQDNAVSVKWNTKADSGAGAAATTDYTAVTAPTTLTFAKGVSSQDFTVATTEDVLAEGNETFLVELTGAVGGTITTAGATGTITDDDAAPTGITLSVDTNGATSGTPSTVAEDAGATVVTVTATVNGTTRYVEAKTVAVSVADGTAASPADYAAVTNFNIIIGAGAASHTGSFTVTPVDDDLDEADETIDVTGTLTDITITGAMVTFTDTDDPVSFSIADAEATEGGKITFTVSRKGAEDNVASVKVATAADSGEGVKAAGTDDYTAIAPAQTLNFAAGTTSQTVEVQTTQDDLFEPDETFRAVLSDPALADGDPGTGVSIEMGKGTAIGTIKNDDTEPSFAVADASASEGDAITFTVTRSGAQDNAVSVKWNTKADSGAGAAATTDYTAVTAPTTLTFAKGVSSQDFTVATTEDVLAEGNETFLVELTGAVGGTITTAGATGTITDDDAAPTGITLSVDTNGATSGTPSTVAEDAGATVVTVTATVNGTTRYVEAKTVAVSVADGTAASPADYAAVTNFNIIIGAGAASHTGSFTVTPVDDDLDEADETIDVTGTLTDITITGAMVTFTDTDDPVSFSIADAEATEGGKITFTVSRKGAEDNVASVKVATAADSGEGVKAAGTDDYTAIAPAQTLNFAAGTTSQTVEVQTTQDDLFEPDETFRAVLSDPALADGDPGTGVSIEMGKGTAIGTIKNDDTEPSFAVADASASEGDAITFTVTRSGAQDNAVSVKWNTKADSGAGAAATTDYTAVTAPTTLTFAKGVSSQDFTVATTEDVLAEGNETFLVELTGAVGGTITTAGATGTITDDDAAPTGITLSVDTNGATSGTPSTVAEDAGATVVTVTATVNGTTRYVEAKTVAVSVADGTAASPADYAAVTNFNIIIGAGAASHTGSFTVTPVDDDLDEADETIDVTGTLTDITITGAMVTFTDTDDPVSFSIADAEATEGGKITFTVSRKGAEDNVASVKVATAADSGEGVKAAGTDDYTAIAPAQTLNFAAGTTSQTVEVQTTQDDLFEPDETFRAVLSDPALADGDPGTGVSIEMGKGTAIGTIKNDDTEPSFAVADASASEGDAITFTVTRSGAQDNAVSVKWNTKADSGAGAAATTDYTAVTAPTTLTFAKGVSSQDFTVATTEDVLAEGNETFLVELTGAVGGTITTAGATGTITDDDAAPTGITLSVDTNGATSGTPSTVAEDAGATVVTVTATVNGTTRYVEAKTVAVSVADGTAASPADYAAVTNFNIIIGAGAASHTGSFTVTPVDDDLDEADETIDVTGTLTDITITGAMVTFTDTDDPVSFSIADAEATEGGKITFTVSRKGAEDNVASVKVATAADSGEGVKAAGTDDYTAIAPAQTLNFAAGTTSQTVEVQTTQDDLFEPDETFRAVLSDPALADGDPGTGVSIEMGKGTAIGTIKNDDTEPSFAVADASASEGDAITFTVTRSGAQDNAVSVKWNTKADSGAGAAATTDYTAVTAPTTLTFAKGVSSQDFTVATTEDVLAEGNETFLVELTGAVGGTITTAGATGTITDDDAAPTGITLSVDTNGATSGTPSTVAEDAGATVVTVTATVNGTTRYVEAKTVAVSVADGTAASPADYAAVTNFNIIIGAGAASHTGSFTVTPVDDDLDEADETIDVTGTLTDITITGAMVTFTDTDDPVSFSIADAEATEGGKITFTVSRKGAEDNVASVKVATAADSGEGVKAAGTDDYTAIAPAQTLNFAAGTTSQTVEVQTTQDDLFEPDETFRAVLSDPALADGDPGTGVSIEMGKGTAIGTIKNDDTEPSFAVADASASEGDAITFTVTRSGAMDNAVSVKWNTKADSGAGAAATSDYTPMTTATTLTFAKGVGTQTFTVATTEDVLAEGNETFLVELTEPVGAIISDAEATGTITDDDAAPSGITLTVSPTSLGEGAGETEITVTATVNGSTRYVDAKTVTVSVGGGTATSATDYAAVTNFDIIIAAGEASKAGTFDLTPTQDNLHEGSETIDVTGTSGALTITKASITITDDDGQPSFAVADASASEGDAITFTVTRSGAMDNAVSVKWNTKADSGAGAAATSDYTPMTTATTLTFAKGVGTQTFTVATTEDVLAEGNETFLVELTEPVGAIISDAEATGTITDDDAAPSGITLTVSPTSLGEGAGETEITVTATVNGSTRYVDAKTVTVSVGGGTATSATDYAAVTNFDIIIAAGEASKAGTFDLTPTQDNLHEGSETIDVTGTSGALTITKASITITDDDGQPSFAVADASASEGDAITFTVTRSGAMDNAVSVKWNTKADSGAGAAATSDYTPMTTATTLTFAKGVGTQTFTVATTEDVLAEGNETFLVELTEPVGAIISDAEATGTITDDDAAPSGITLTVSPTSLGEGAGETEITVTATVNGSTRYVDAKTVTVSVGGGTATSATDYAAVTNFDIIIAAGEASKAGTFDLTPTQDNLHEGSETIDVTGTSGALTITKASITITDDDGQPSFAVADASASEGDAITFTVTRSGAMDNAVSVKWNTKADSGAGAAATSDYTPMTTATTLTFAKGVGTQTFTVATTEDVLAEGNETFLVELTEPVGAIISDAEATGTITDDDAAPSGITLTVSPTSLGEGAGETEITVTATVNGSTRYVDAKTVTVSVGGGTATSATDYAAVTNFDIIIAAGEASKAGTFDLTPTQDNLHEGSETIDVTGTSGALTITKASITITDDDGQPSFAVADASASEGDAITFTVTRSGAMDNAVSVKWNTKADSGAGAAATSDYTPMTTATTLTFAKGVGTQTFTVATTEDVLAEGNETFLVELTEPVGAIISDAEATGTITDDDAAPSGITLTVSPTSLGEGAGETEITVTATVNGSTRYVDAKTVTVSVGGGTATSATDYAAVTNFDIIIAAGEASKAGTFDLTPTQDNLHEGSETIDVTGTSGALTITKASITITDDDGQPSFAVADASASEGDAITFTVTRSGAMDNAVSVKWNTKADSGAGAAATSDYTPMTTATTLTFAKGVGTQTFTVATTEDVLAEGNETFLVELTEPVGAIISDAEATGTITDDDAAPSGITLTVSPTSLGEGAGETEITVTATVNGSTRYVDAKTVTVSVGGGTATSATDYAAVTNFDIIIAAGEASKAGTFDLTPTQDNLHEGSETIDVTGTSGALTITKASITITDDDGQPSFAVADASASEGDAITFTVTRSGAMDNAVSVKWNTKADSGAGAAATSDYTPMTTATTLTFAKGVGTQTFTVATTEDVLAEGNETFLVELTEPVGAIISDAEATGTITDDDAAPSGITLTVSPTSLGEGAGETEITVTATVNGSTRYVDAKTVTVSVGGGTATSATDYAAVTNFDIIIAAGEASKAGTFDLTPTQDNLHEGSETIDVTGTSGALTITKASITITDDDGQPSFAVADASASEGDAITFTVTRSGAMDNAVSVKWNTKADSGAGAAATSDYTPMTTATTLTFAKGVGTQTFTVATTEDVLAEGNETFLVELTEPVGAIISDAEATGTITDDDAAPSGITLTVDADTGTMGTQTSLAEDGGVKTVRVTATLDGSSTFTTAKTVTVEVGGDADGSTEGTDYAEVTTRSITIDAGKSSGYVDFPLTPTDDDLDEPDEGISIEGTLTGLMVTGTSLTLTDDEDTPTVTLVLTPTTIDESGATNTSTVTATLSGESSVAMTLTVTAAPTGTDTAVGDFTLSSNTTLTIAAGATTSTGAVTITAEDNNVDAPNKSVTVSATASGGVSGVSNPTSQILTITDDDDVAPTVTLVLTPATISESGSTNASTVTAMLSGESGAAVTVTVAAAAGADTVAGDFTLSTNKTLTIAAGATTSTGAVTITAVDNDVDAPNKSVTVSATASGGGVANPDNQTLTINDDDAAPTGITLSVLPATVGEGDGETEITVTATVNGSTRYVDAKTVTVSVGGGTATSATDYAAVTNFDIIIAAGEASKAGTFDLTPTQDNLHEGSETIDVTGTSGGPTITPATLTITDDDAAPSAIKITVDADMGTPGAQTSLEEDGGAKKVRVTATLDGSSTFTETKTVTLEVGADADSATEGTDYAEVMRRSITINAEAASGYVEFTLTPTPDTLHEGSETISLDGTLTGVTVTDAAITLNDDDAAPTALTLSVDADTGTDGTQTTIAEDGGAKTVRVTATITGETRFVETRTVTLEVGADADSATEGTDYAEVMRRNITINAEAASGYVEFTLTPTDDARHEGSETISLEGALTDVTVTGTSLTITDDEDTPTVTLVLTPATINESGATNTSTVTATLSGESIAAVTVTVAAAAGAGTAVGDFTLSSNKTLTIAAGATTSTGAVTITAVDNDVDAPNKSVTVSATASGGGVTNPEDQTLTITDDDAAPTGITLSVSPDTVGEGDGETEITVTATVNGTTRYVDAKTVTVSVGGGTAVSGTDYSAVSSFDITIAAGDASKAGTFDLEPTDDAVHEENETIDVTGSSGVLDITKASITITDDDDRSDPMLAAWLGRFGRGVAEQALDGIAGRIAASRSAGMQGTVAGKALALGNPGPTPWNFGAGRSFGYAARSDPTISFDADSGSNPSDPVAMTAREVLLGSSFTATGETATGGSLALWGRTAQSSFDGQDGAFSLDGETTSAMLGADYARDGWLLGLALMHSSGKGGYSDTQVRPCPAGTVGQSPCSEAVRTGGGTVKATMTAVLPYASLQVSERLRFWGALGHGSGEVTLMPEPGGTLSADISWSMAATGLRGDVITAGQGSNFSLAFTSDMLWSRTRSEKTHELAASSATVTRLRAGLEAGWQMPLEHGSWLTPRLEIGARHDGGDAETGLGVELGGGLAWTDPGRGLSLDLSARTLIVHDDDDIKDQGFAAAFSFDPQPDSARGLSLSLRQDAGGQPEGGLNALFTPEPLSARSGASGSSHSAEAAYGLPALSGRFTFTPHVGLSLAEESRDFRFGWRLTPEATAAPDLSIGLVATRRESAAARPVHGVGLGMTFRW